MVSRRRVSTLVRLWVQRFRGVGDTFIEFYVRNAHHIYEYNEAYIIERVGRSELRRRKNHPVKNYEYTIEVGYDMHVHAGYENYVTSTPEEALERRGAWFHPDFDNVVRREVGTEKWEFFAEDQKYDYFQKVQDYKEALEERRRNHELWRPKKSSALPNNRRARTRGVMGRDHDTRLWLYVKGELDIERTFSKESHHGNGQ